MQAIVSHKYGELKLDEIDKPELEPDRVLVRIRAAAVNPLDYHEVRGKPYFARAFLGLTKPKQSRRGVDAAGIVEAVGENVTELHPGDEVFGQCRGAFAEYARGTEESLVAKPERLTFEQAAAITVAGVTALQALRDVGGIKSGQRVLVNGASGGVGTFAVQIAKAFGASVTGVCSTRNVELVRSLGADHVVDYTADDFTRSGERYDVIVNAVDSRSTRDLKRALAPSGTLVVVAGSLRQIFGAMLLRRFRRQRILGFIADVTKERLDTLKELVDAGKVTPVIDRTYPLRETPEAIRYVEAGHARGKVVVVP
ncbi:MAG: NAD(P)-dependent alcohol dehydrogenase [Gaiellaceae bacterium]